MGKYWTDGQMQAKASVFGMVHNYVHVSWHRPISRKYTFWTHAVYLHYHSKRATTIGGIECNAMRCNLITQCPFMSEEY